MSLALVRYGSERLGRRSWRWLDEPFDLARGDAFPDDAGDEVGPGLVVEVEA